MPPTQTCATCACWFATNLSGQDQDLIAGRPDYGACKEGPVTVSKNRRDWCVTRWRLREAAASASKGSRNDPA